MKKVLIVDDDQLLRLSLAKALRDSHTEVKTVQSGEEALEAIKASDYDLCFLDVFLPGMNGMEVMKKVNAITPETKIIIMTSSELSNESKREIAEGAYQFLPKPFDLFQIKMIVKHAVEKPLHASVGAAATFEDLMHEKRRSKRRPFNDTIDYSLFEDIVDARIVHLRGNIIDISDTGIGICTTHPLSHGNTIGFKMGMEEKFGIVKWSVNEDNVYRAGIQLVQ